MKPSCPVCKKTVLWEGNVFRPFCSDVCRQRDLGNWATESYRVKADEHTPGLTILPDPDDSDE